MEHDRGATGVHRAAEALLQSQGLDGGLRVERFLHALISSCLQSKGVLCRAAASEVFGGKGEFGARQYLLRAPSVVIIRLSPG